MLGSRSPSAGGFEPDSKARSRGGGQALKGLRGRACPPALETSNDGLGGFHASGELFLRKTRRDTRFDDCARERELRRKFLMSFPILLALHPLLVKIFDLAHGDNSLARFRANSISRFGVFWDFLTKTLTTTTGRRSQ